MHVTTSGHLLVIINIIYIQFQLNIHTANCQLYSLQKEARKEYFQKLILQIIKKIKNLKQPIHLILIKI